jgi:hypothetical protein
MKSADASLGFPALSVFGALLPLLLGGACSSESRVVGSIDPAEPPPGSSFGGEVAKGGSPGGGASGAVDGTGAEAAAGVGPAAGVGGSRSLGGGGAGARSGGVGGGGRGGAAGEESPVASAGRNVAGAGGSVAGPGGATTAEGGESYLGCGPHMICETRACIEGFADCNASVEDGCEVSIGLADAHCGRCGNSCLPAGSCVNGECVPVGAAGQAGAGGAPEEPASSPCEGLCESWRTIPLIGGVSYRIENLTTDDVCFENVGYAEAVAAGSPRIVCWEFSAERKLEVNGVEVACSTVGAELSMGTRAGGYCVHAHAGDYAFAGFELPLL